MPQTTFAARFEGSADDQKRKASLLRTVLIVVIVLLPLALVSDFLTGDLVNAALEGLVFFCMLLSLVVLYRGNYLLASRLTVAAAFFVLLAMSMVVSSESASLLFRNVAYYTVAITLSLLFTSDRRMVLGIAGLGVAAFPAFAFLRLLPAGIPMVEVLPQLVTSLILYVLVAFFCLKYMELTTRLNMELAEERSQGEKRLEKLSRLVEGATANLDSIGSLNARVEEIRSLVADAAASIQAIQGRVTGLESSSDSSTQAAARIGERITELNDSIEEESAAQIESSASINEMVASIRSVADSATRRRGSMEGLAGTADEGMRRLDSLLALISKIEGSIGSIQSMVNVINSIAGSTNLLSMNAAIEAAHAGDAGRGFAVVAEEIRKLADTSGKNAKEIGRQLKEVIAIITGAAEESDRTKDSFLEIRREIDGAVDAFQEITAATGELAEGGRQILEALRTLSEMSGRVKAGGTEIGEAQHTMEELQRSTKAALAALRADATVVGVKDAAILAAVDLVSQVGEAGARNAAELHRMSSFGD